MRIDELFDQPLPLTWGIGGSGSHQNAEFTVDDDEFQISFDAEWPAYHDPDPEDEHVPKEISVSFGVAGRAHYWDMRDTDTSSNFKRKAALIFSTVAYAIDIYWKEENPDSMFFAASADRQVKTYDMMARFINRTKPYNIRKKYDPGSDDYYYEITKGINEDNDTLELPDIEVGDEVKIGKFKNRKATVKGFKKDEKDNHPVLKTTKGDTKLFKPRITKIEEAKWWNFKNKEVDWNTADENELRAFVNKVHQDCQFYLSNKSPDVNLIRGVTKHLVRSKYLYNKTIHTDRKRKRSSDADSDNARNAALSDLMQADGFIATRTNGVFCFGIEGTYYDRGELTLHGVPYIIFPIGQFDLTWYNRRQVGGMIDLGSSGWHHRAGISSDLLTNAPAEDVAREFWDKHRSAFKHGTNVDEAARGESEITIAGNGYHAIDASMYFQFKKMKDLGI